MKSVPHKNQSAIEKSSPAAALRPQMEKRAQEIWLAAGCPHGSDISHWLQAEREVIGQRPPGARRSVPALPEQFERSAPPENTNGQRKR